MNKKIIPELPKEVEELRILWRTEFKVEEEYSSISISAQGKKSNEVTKKELLLKCPSCQNKFKAKREIYGPYRSRTVSTDPNICPYCDFPKSIICALFKKEGQGTP